MARRRQKTERNVRFYRFYEKLNFVRCPSDSQSDSNKKIRRFLPSPRSFSSRHLNYLNTPCNEHRLELFFFFFSKCKVLKISVHIGKRLVEVFVWSVALYRSESWVIYTAEERYLESFKMRC